MERSGSRWIRANPLQSDVTVHWPKCWTTNRNGDICHSSPPWQPVWCPPVIPLCIAAGLQLSLAHRCNPMDRTERGCYIFCSVHFFMHPVLGRVLYYLAAHTVLSLTSTHKVLQIWIQRCYPQHNTHQLSWTTIRTMVNLASLSLYRWYTEGGEV